MTRLREEAIKMIKDIPEDKIMYVLNILKNVKNLSEETRQEDNLIDKAQALQILQKFKGRLPETFDFKNSEIEVKLPQELLIE